MSKIERQKILYAMHTRTWEYSIHSCSVAHYAKPAAAGTAAERNIYLFYYCRKRMIIPSPESTTMLHDVTYVYKA